MIFCVNICFVIDDEGNNITLFSVSISFYEDENNCFVISQNGFIHGKYVKSIKTLDIDNFSTLFCEKTQFSALRNLGSVCFSTTENLKLTTEFLTKDEDDEDKIKFNQRLNDNPKKSVGLGFKIESDTKVALSKMQQALDYWRELFFLIYGFSPAYYEIEIVYDKKPLIYCHYNSRFPQKSTFFKKIEPLYHETFDWSNIYQQRKIARENTGISFDIFASTIYLDTFLEDYPLKLIQCLEGYICGIEEPKKEFVKYSNEQKILSIIDSFIENNSPLEKSTDFREQI